MSLEQIKKTVTAGRHAATQQALVLAHGYSKAETARLMGVSTYTIWQSINALPGSTRRDWDDRTEDERMAARVAARIVAMGVN